MKRAKVERNMVVVLFILVLVTFSFAQRDSERFTRLYAAVAYKVNTLFASRTDGGK